MALRHKSSDADNSEKPKCLLCIVRRSIEALTLHHNASSHHTGILLSYILHCYKSEYSSIKYFECVRARDHIHIIFITVYCYNCSSLLLVIVVNLLLCLIYRLNFIIGMYVRRKYSLYWVWYYLQFQASTGGLGTCPLCIQGDFCVQKYLITFQFRKLFMSLTN